MSTSRPEGYHSITPYLFQRHTEAALTFYKEGFNAEVIMEMPGPSGKIGHAEIRIGDSVIMLAEEYPEMGYPSPETLGGTPVSLMLYVDDVDSLFAQAIKAGATEVQAVADQFYGDRAGTLKDPSGHVWTLATHIKDLSNDELQSHIENSNKNTRENKDA